MDLAELLKLLGNNAAAVEFATKLHKDLEEQKSNVLKLVEDVDKYKSLATDSEKYKAEAKKAFEDRDKYKEQLNNAKKGDDKELLETIEKLKSESQNLKTQILQKEQNEILEGVLSGLQFKGEDEEEAAEAKEYVKSKLLKGLTKNDELGWVYVDENGKPKRNHEDPTKFLDPKSFLQTKGMKKTIGTYTVVKTGGDGFQGGGGKGGDTQPKSSRDMIFEYANRK